MRVGSQEARVEGGASYVSVSTSGGRKRGHGSNGFAVHHGVRPPLTMRSWAA